MKRFAVFALTAAALFLPSAGQARVFTLNKQTFASYLIFNYGTSKIDDAPFVNESTAAAFDAGVKTNVGGEFGFIYSTPFVNWRFGLELLKPPAVSDVKATDAAGTRLYLAKTDISAVMPKVGLELNIYKGAASRWMVFATVGQSNVEVTNSYTSVTIPPTTDFTAKYKGAAGSRAAGLSFEFAGFDTVSLVFEAGYREMKITGLKYAAAVTGFGNTAHAVGDDVLWTDGSAREIDLSGAYGSFGARFWLF